MSGLQLIMAKVWREKMLSSWPGMEQMQSVLNIPNTKLHLSFEVQVLPVSNHQNTEIIAAFGMQP